MTLLIDGHNLIGAGVFRDIQLSDEDDEAKLVARLKIWRSRIRRNIIVFFDRGIPGGRDHRMSGAGVEVVFAANPTEADDLIRRRLERASRNTVLVTNDDALARTADAHGIERWRGAEFVARMAMRLPDLPVAEAGEEWDVRLSPKEVEEWLEIFRAARKTRRAKREARAKAQAATNGTRPGAKRKRKTTRAQPDAPISIKQEFEQAMQQRKPVQRKPAKQSQRKARKAARARRRLGSDSGDAGSVKADE